MRLLPSALAAVAVSLSFASPPSAQASDTIQVPQNYAKERVVKIDVTQMGLVLDLGSPISSVDLSHMSDVIFRGLDGALCDKSAECPDTPPPTKLFLRRIPPIKFKHVLPSPDGTRMLFVNTSAGLYRFQIKPVTGAPKYTSVKVQPDFPTTAFPNAIMR